MKKHQIDGFGETILSEQQVARIAKENKLTNEQVREIEKGCRQRYIADKAHKGLSKEEYAKRIFDMVDVNAQADIRAFTKMIANANARGAKVTEKVGKRGTGYVIIE